MYVSATWLGFRSNAIIRLEKFVAGDKYYAAGDCNLVVSEIKVYMHKCG